MADGVQVPQTIQALLDKDIAELEALFKAAETVTLTGHTRADGDDLGSITALALYLSEVRGKDVACVLPDTPPENLRFILPEGIPFFFHDTAPDLTEKRVAHSDLLVLLDCNNFFRTADLCGVLKSASAQKVLIDHHLNPETEDFKLYFSVPEMSSACELLYWMLVRLGCGADDLPKKAAEGLFTGMTTDTNNFSNSVSPSTFRMAGELVRAGVDRDALLQKIYNNHRENRIRLMGYMQYKEMQITPFGAAYMIMSKKVREKFDIQDGETEGLVNVPLAISDVRMSILLKERDGEYSVSIRTKKGVSAQNFAMQFFHGGGHENAAGGKLHIGEDILHAEDAAEYVRNAAFTFLQ